MLKALLYGKSDVGLKRTNNEDAFLLKAELGLCVLADGMGGAAAGELASQFFAETALEVFSKADHRSEDNNVQLIQGSYDLANQRILQHVKENPEHKGMGCTAELLVLHGERFALGHVGDSRTYLLRHGVLKQLTRDHSLVQEQLDQALITQDEARKHPLRNVILRAVGTQESLAVDLIRGAIVPQDIFLQCSDGLSDMIDDGTIQSVLILPVGLPEKSERLIDLAKQAGGLDNITVVLSEIVND
jgi:serine/threonine protein phosphatase PrpC